MRGSSVLAVFICMVAVTNSGTRPVHEVAHLHGTVAVLGAEMQACTFVDEFATLRDLLGAQAVGSCLEDQRTTGNGNVEQRTTNGVLVVSALDWYPRFTTTDHTWIGTPSGLVDRPNTQRFDWEGDQQLVDQLRQGGYLLYFRHGPTAPIPQDSDPYDVADCQTQRNLTDLGRSQGAVTGIHLRTLQIPVGEVISSPFCRAREYAYLLFGRVSELDATLIGPDVPLDPDVLRANVEAFQQRLRTAAPPPGENLVVVGHSPIIRSVLGIDLTVEGSAAILDPVPGLLPRPVARVLPDEWASFARAMASE